MIETLLDYYPLEYLITHKDRDLGFYPWIYGACVSLLNGQHLSETVLVISWNAFRRLALLPSNKLDHKTFAKIRKTFVDKFNHSGEESKVFLEWHFAGFILDHPADSDPDDLDTENEETMSPDEIAAFEEEIERKAPMIIKAGDIMFKCHFERHLPFPQRPSVQDMRSFAKEILPLIEEPKVKETLTKTSLGRLFDWLRPEDQCALDQIGAWTLQDGKDLSDAKPLVDRLKKDYAKQNAQPLDITPTAVDAVTLDLQESTGEIVTVLSERTAALNQLSILWVKYNQGHRISKSDDMAWFLSEYIKRVGLDFVAVSEFKKHLKKAYKAGLISKDERARRYIPKLGT